MFERHFPTYRERQETRFDVEIQRLKEDYNTLCDSCRWIAYTVVACIIGLIFMAIILAMQSHRIHKLENNQLPPNSKLEITQ